MRALYHYPNKRTWIDIYKTPRREIKR